MHRISIRHLSLPTDIWIPDYATHNQRWEFIKENKKIRFSTKKAIRRKEKIRKFAPDQESDQEKSITVKKKRKKTRSPRPRRK